MAAIKIAQLTNQLTLNDTDTVIVETATGTNKMNVGNLRKGLLETNETLWTGVAGIGTSIPLSEIATNFTFLEIVTSDATGGSSLKGTLVYTFGGVKFMPVMFGVTMTYARVATSADNLFFTMLDCGQPNLRIIAINGLLRK